MRVDSYNSGQARGTVLILCVALLVLLGLAATTFVLLSHADRTGSRALSRADRFEQVRQMTLEHIRAMLLEDLVGNDGIFLNGDASDEAYDAPLDDRWMASHEIYQPDPNNNSDVYQWSYISNVAGDGSRPYERVFITDADVENLSDYEKRVYLTTDNSTDTDADGIRDARWIEDSSLPFTMRTAPDGTRYRVAIRIVDTGGLANINVGQVQTDDANIQKLWDSQYPAHFNLRSLIAKNQSGDELDAGADLDTKDIAGAYIGRYNETFSADSIQDLYDWIYVYLATGMAVDPAPATPARAPLPFDSAEEIALRLRAAGVDANSRFAALWPNTFAQRPYLFTAYSWTAQIRPPITDQDIEDELAALGYPAPCKIPLTGLLDSDLLVADRSRKAVYLTLLAAGVNANEASAFLVNLIDYIDGDSNPSTVSSGAATDVIDFDAWGTAVSKPDAGTILYGMENQPIITEVYSYREYEAIWNDATLEYDYQKALSFCRYAVELFNPGPAIDLSGWKLDINGVTYDLGVLPQGGFVSISSHDNDHTATDIPNRLVKGPTFAIGEGSQTIKLKRPVAPGGLVTIDAFSKDFSSEPASSGVDPNPPPPILEDSQRPGLPVPYDQYAEPPYDDDDLQPTIAPFSDLTASPTLSDYPLEIVDNVNKGHGGQIVLRNGPLHNLGEIFYVPKIANDGTGAKLIEQMVGQTDGDSNYRLDPSSDGDVLQYLTLRTGLYDNTDNDGDGNVDGAAGVASDDSILLEARVPGLININTAPGEVINALHYYYEKDDFGVTMFATLRRESPKLDLMTFESLADLATLWGQIGKALSKDEDPDSEIVGSPDGVLVDNEQKLFYFSNAANLITVRSDTFVVYITVQASNKDGIFDTDGRTVRTMAILDRSLCLRPNGTADIPLPRIVAQAVLPP